MLIIFSWFLLYFVTVSNVNIIDLNVGTGNLFFIYLYTYRICVFEKLIDLGKRLFS